MPLSRNRGHCKQKKMELSLSEMKVAKAELKWWQEHRWSAQHQRAEGLRGFALLRGRRKKLMRKRSKFGRKGKRPVIWEEKGSRGQKVEARKIGGGEEGGRCQVTKDQVKICIPVVSGHRWQRRRQNSYYAFCALTGRCGCQISRSDNILGATHPILQEVLIRACTVGHHGAFIRLNKIVIQDKYILIPV